MKKLKYRPIYKYGGLAQIGNTAGSFVDLIGMQSDGTQTDLSSIGSGALKGAGTGAALGSIVPGIGTAVGAGVGAIVGGIGSFFRNKDKRSVIEKAKQEYEKAKQLAELEQDKALLESYPSQGLEGASFYRALGGRIPRYDKGGKLLPISSNTTIVNGPSHEMGGVDLGVAEVEGNEVIKDGSKVFSDRLTPNGEQSFAEIATILSAIKAEQEKASRNSTSNIEANTRNRNIEKLNLKLDRLFEKQEASKGFASNTIMSYGGKLKYQSGGEVPATLTGTSVFDNADKWWEKPKEEKDDSSPERVDKVLTNISSIAEGALPYVDNLFNAYLNKKTPELPAPNMLRVMPIRTRINVSPALREIDRNTSSLIRNLDINTSDPAVARSNKIATAIEGGNAKARVLGDAAIREVALDNQNIANVQNIANQNLMADYNYKLGNIDRANAIMSRMSTNVANATNDGMMQIRERNLRDLDDSKIIIDALRYAESGVDSRLLDSPYYVEVLRRNPQYRAQLRTILARTRPQDLTRFDELFPND